MSEYMSHYGWGGVWVSASSRTRVIDNPIYNRPRRKALFDIGGDAVVPLPRIVVSLSAIRSSNPFFCLAVP